MKTTYSSSDILSSMTKCGCECHHGSQSLTIRHEEPCCGYSSMTLDEAVKILKEEGMYSESGIVLSANDFDAFVSKLSEPPKVNEALQTAAKRHCGKCQTCSCKKK